MRVREYSPNPISMVLAHEPVSPPVFEVGKTPEPQISTIEAVTEQPAILLIETQPRVACAALGFPDGYTQWFVDAMGVPNDRITTVNITEQAIPRALDHYAGIIIGGSKETAFEDYPGKSDLEEFVVFATGQERPIWGVCFGHQVIHQALGGKVERGTKGREIGMAFIELNQDGQRDPLFEDVKSDFWVGTSHMDVVTKLPQRGDIVELARSWKYPNQAHAIGSLIRTTQFHPEMTSTIASDIVRLRADALLSERFLRRAADVFDYEEQVRQTDIETAGRQIAHNFNKNFVHPYARRTS